MVSIYLHTFSSPFWKFPKFPCGKSLFQLPVDKMMHCFLDVPQRLVMLASQLFLHITKKLVVGECQGGTVGRVQKSFPPKFLFFFFHCEMSRVRPGVIMLHDDLSMAFLAHCTTELQKCLDIADSIMGCPGSRNSTRMQPSAFLIPFHERSSSQMRPLRTHLGCSCSQLWNVSPISFKASPDCKQMFRNNIEQFLNSCETLFRVQTQVSISMFLK